jgi:acyl-CoA reductase-like NAD-dependent aldehyde dehydrogenase
MTATPNSLDGPRTARSVRTRGLFIDGEERPAAERSTFPIVSPGTGETIAHTVDASGVDVDEAIASARRAFRDSSWREMPERIRSKLVYKLGNVLEDNLDELYELETLNNGRPLRETRAQLDGIADMFRYNASLAMTRRDAVIPTGAGHLTYTLRRPVGVVANATPFNHPLAIASRCVAPSLASGCTVVLKPSEYTPLTTIRMWELFQEAGLPPGVFNVVTGFGASTGKALSGNPGINKLVLTGGTETGRLAAAAAGANFVDQTLELGGKTPVVVFDDYDVDQAVNYAAFGTYIAAGQTCLCSSRHIVQRSIYDEFVEKLAAKADGIRVGDPFGARTQMGPVVSERQRQRVLDFIRVGLAEGARLVAGGGIPEGLKESGGFYLDPTVFADVTPDMRIAREEVFGPVTAVIPFDTEEDAIRIANDSPYGLAAAIRTNDVGRAHRYAEEVEAGVVWINDHHRGNYGSPHGGIKDSGVGREFGTEAFDSFFYTKSVHVNKAGESFDWFEEEMRDLRLN